MYRIVAILMVVFLLIGTAAGCKPQAAVSPEAGKVLIAMGFIPNVQFTPFYVALERGYFAAEGLVVTLDYGMETDLLQQVGSGNLRFAVASGDQVVLARANGLPVRYVANWYRRFPVCVVSLAETGIVNPSDLAGKVVGIPELMGASYIGWKAFVSESGLSESQVDLRPIGYTQIASLTEGRVDAAVCYAMNEPVQLRESGREINVLTLDNYTHLVSNGLITNDETIQHDPELVGAVVRAFLRGLADTIVDPDAAFTITRKAIPEITDETAPLQRAVLLECINYWKGKVLGLSDPAAWEESVALLKELGMITTAVEPTDLYTNQFIAVE